MIVESQNQQFLVANCSKHFSCICFSPADEYRVAEKNGLLATKSKKVEKHFRSM